MNPISWLLSIFFASINLFRILIRFYSLRGIYIWLIIELNLVSFVGIRIANMSKRTSLALLKYFRCQALISVFFLFLFVGRATFIISDFYLNLYIILILFCKLGAAPFHMWFVRVIIKLDWFSFIWIFSFQKLIPLFFLLKFYLFWGHLLVLRVLSSLIHGLLVIKIKKALILSSVFRINWIYARIIIAGNLWFIYFLVYSIVKIVIVLVVIADFSKRLSATRVGLRGGLLVFSYFIFLAGIPPSPIFFLKMIIVRHIISLNILIITLVLLTSSIIFIYIYINSVVFYCCQSVKYYRIRIFLDNSLRTKLFFHVILFCITRCTLFLLINFRYY